MNLTEVLSFLGVVHNCKDASLNNIQIDSRKVIAGDLFVAVPGLKSDGRDYIPQALSNGAAAILVAEPYTVTEHLSSIPVIIIPNLEQRLTDLTAFFYSYPARSAKIIGFTGTNGKTSCSHYTAQMLNAVDLPCGVMGTLGNGMLPDLTPSSLTTSDCCTVQQQFAEFRESNVNYISMEVSSHALMQGRLAGIDFDTAVFTNLSQDHLDYHGTLQEYFAAKARLFVDYKPKNCVFNLDDPFTAELLKLVRHDPCIITYSLNDKTADIYIEHNRIYTPWGIGVFSTPLIGNFNLYNVMACVAVCGLQEISLDEILYGIINLVPVAGRMQNVETSNPAAPLVIIDYAHTPDALVKALDTLREYCTGSLFCVFGCGGDRDRSKRPLMLKAVLEYADVVVITQDNPRTEDPEQIVQDMLSGDQKKSNIKIELDRATAINETVALATAKDVILIAGKGHEDYQIIGTQKFPFSDLLIAQQALAVRGETECVN